MMKCSYTEDQQNAMTKEEMIAEVEFLKLCHKEMPSAQTAYDIEILENYLSLFYQVGSIFGMMKKLRNTMNQYSQFFPQTEAEKVEEDELFRLMETL